VSDRPGAVWEDRHVDENEAWLARAVRLATASVARSGGPFGAFVVRGGEVLGEGTNRVTADLDPTAHAEVVAIRAACRRTGDFTLPGATVYASCEPCPLCLAAALWARVDAVVFAADREAAARAGFDDAAFYRLLRPAVDPSAWPVRIVHLPTTTSEEPFEAWLASEGRTPY
jgi:guanine deaminase